MKQTICEVLGVHSTISHGSYLGLPSILGINKSEFFAFLREKAWIQMHGWKHKFLSRAGKEVSLKEVVQALLSYVMSVLFFLVSYVRSLSA